MPRRRTRGAAACDPMGSPSDDLTRRTGLDQTTRDTRDRDAIRALTYAATGRPDIAPWMREQVAILDLTSTAVTMRDEGRAAVLRRRQQPVVGSPRAGGGPRITSRTTGPAPLAPRLRGLCGTDHGWHHHRQHSQTPCRPCIVAHDVAMAAWTEARAVRAQAIAAGDAEDTPPPPIPTSPPDPRHLTADCGTAAGYLRHRHVGESPCGFCRRAWADELGVPSGTARHYDAYYRQGKAVVDGHRR